MRYFVRFQVREIVSARPEDCGQDEPLELPEPTWIPSPGDSITLQYGGEPKAFVILTRHFNYSLADNRYSVNVTMRSATPEEMLSRLKD